jgi:hypothetical protein
MLMYGIAFPATRDILTAILFSLSIEKNINARKEQRI